MLKFNNLKILLLLMLFAFAGKNAWAGYHAWFHFQAEAKTNTGEGLVYGQFENQSAQDETLCETNEITSQQHKHFDNLDNHPTSMSLNFYMVAKAKPGYRFVEWEEVVGDTYTKVSNSEYATRYGIVDERVGFANSSVTSSNKCSDESSYDEPAHDTIPNYMYTTNATFFAKFEPLDGVSAVLATVNNELWGAASANPIINAVDTVVKLFAVGPSDLNNRLGYEKKFVGWKKDNVIVSKDTVYSFKITEENKGTYTAVFEDGYKFHRIKNRATENYITAINDQGGLDDLSSLKLVNGLENVIFDAGSIIEIEKGQVYNDKKKSKRTYYNYIVQGADSKLFYDFKYDDPNGKNPYTPNGVFVRMPYNASYNNWLFSTDDVGSLRLRDNNEKVDFTAVNTSNTEWYIEPMDKDLNTKENYFSLDPNKLVEVGGKYYTTLRTSWNILFNPVQMTPYIVKSVNETEGTFEMEPISGNIIPAGTPVIIETKSRDIEENRMVPTKKAEASGAVPSGNQLVSSTKYFPNQSVAVADNYKKLMVNANGQLAFGGNALDTVNGNEAYLRVASEVVKIPILPLADIERDGIKDKHYTIADQLIAVDYCHVDGTEDVYLWCKDQKNASIFPTNKNEDQIDFMRQGGNDAPQKGEWDQSNWVVLKLTGPDGLNKAEEAVPTIEGQKQKRFIKEKTVTGKYIDDKNFMIEVENNNFTVEDGEASFTPNVYATTNFLLENLNIWGDERDGGYTSGNPNQNYFFMNPKIQEVCTVTYAVWDKDRSMFVVPSSSGFTGSINVAWDYNEPLGVAEALTQVIENSQEEIAYNFLAVVNRTDFGYGPGFEPSKSTSDNPLLVYPLNLDPANENNVITAVDGVQSGKTVTHVVYYNLMGVESDKPHPGINIVETRYSDGTRTTTKIIR